MEFTPQKAASNHELKCNHLSICFNSMMASGILFICLFFWPLLPVSAQGNDVLDKKDDSPELLGEKPHSLTCVPPSALTYTSNAAFYCTGIPISPNIMSYAGSPHTSILISPDLPAGLSFDTATGTISGTPVLPVAGNYYVLVNNACGGFGRIIYIAVSSGTNYYADEDRDGYGSGLPTVSCSGQPPNTSTNNTDCAPNDSSKWRSSKLYFDQDGDKYSNGFPATNVCYGSALPAGRISEFIGTDCLDSNPAVNPNVSEVPGNLIDDNCDGVIDEVAPTSSLMAGSCGVVVPSLSTVLFAQPIVNAQAYRFEVTNGGIARVFETNLNQFRLWDISPGSSTSTTSTRNLVRVSVKTGGFWRPYGASCIVDTGTVPNSTSVVQPKCGSFLTDIWNTIYCYQIPNATGYRFRVKKNGVLIGTVDRPINNFTIVDVGINNLEFATAYTIDVLLQLNNVWLPDTDYGISCVIVTPPTPGVSRITMPSCGSSTSNTWECIYAVPITGAQGYKFVFNNGIRNREYVTPLSSMCINNIPGGPMIGTTYTIRVDVLYHNSYVPGRELCTLTLLPASPRLADSPQNIFEVKSSPNPFTDHFSLTINTSREEPIDISVFDMFGRLVTVFRKEVDRLDKLILGEDLASGVYTLVVNQGTSGKTLRVIKR